MAQRRDAELIRSHSEHRRIEDAYMCVLLETFTPDEWRVVVSNTRTLAQAGGETTRAPDEHRNLIDDFGKSLRG